MKSTTIFIICILSFLGAGGCRRHAVAFAGRQPPAFDQLPISHYACEKYDDRHVRNKIEGINRSRGEAAETVHHLFMAHLKGYESQTLYEEYRSRYQECIRMLNGMERTLEKQLPEPARRWPDASVREDPAVYTTSPSGFPEPSLPEPFSPLSPPPEP